MAHTQALALPLHRPLPPREFPDCPYRSACNPQPYHPSPSSTLLTVLNGHVVPSPSSSSLLRSIFVGSIQQLPPDLQLKVSSMVNARFDDGDVFFDLNGIGAANVAVVYVPAGIRVLEEPVHLRFCYDEGREGGRGGEVGGVEPKGSGHGGEGGGGGGRGGASGGWGGGGGGEGEVLLGEYGGRGRCGGGGEGLTYVRAEAVGGGHPCQVDFYAAGACRDFMVIDAFDFNLAMYVIYVFYEA